MSLAVGSVLVIVGLLALLLCLMLSAHRRKLASEIGPRRESRGLEKLKPFFRRDIVEARVRSSFPNTDPREILQFLDSDLPTVWGLERLQLAILKLSNGDLNQLQYYVDAAKRDFLSVIGQAEYPEALRVGLDNYARLSNPEQEVIHKKDLRQYVHWVKKR